MANRKRRSQPPPRYTDHVDNDYVEAHEDVVLKEVEEVLIGEEEVIEDQDQEEHEEQEDGGGEEDDEEYKQEELSNKRRPRTEGTGRDKKEPAPKHNRPEGSDSNRRVQKRPKRNHHPTSRSYDRCPTTNKYYVYSKTHRHLIQPHFLGNKDFLRTTQAFRYHYFAKNITKETKNSIIQYIFDQYVFYDVDEARGKSKIYKNIDDRRYLNLDHLSRDASLIEERTAEWVKLHKPSDYVLEFEASRPRKSSTTGSSNSKRSTVEASSRSRTKKSTENDVGGNHTSVSTSEAVKKKVNNDQGHDDFIPRENREISQHLHTFHGSDVPNDDGRTNPNYYIEELAYHYYYDQGYAMRKQHQHQTPHEQRAILLEPLPPPPPIPSPPELVGNNDNPPDITWTYDPTSRIYLVDFTKVPDGAAIPMLHKHFLGTLMERDDITVICEGLYDHTKFINEATMKDFLYDLGHNFGTIPYAKFRQFNRIVSTTDDTSTAATKEHVTYEEVDGYSSMNVISDYIPYIDQIVYGAAGPKEIHDDDVDKNLTVKSDTILRTPATLVSEIVPEGCAVIHIDDDDDDDENENNNNADNRWSNTNDSPTTTSTRCVSSAVAAASTPVKSITPTDAATSTTTPKDCCIYMTDVEMATYFPRFDYEYKQQFKMKELLPGGTWCLMNHLPVQSRPFMGPNLYISPGGGYTQFHQDGHGTVDSGHSCMSGYNEVVMLRRLPECHKRQACQLIPSYSSSTMMDNDPTVAPGLDGFTPFTGYQNQAENVLYRLPHDDCRNEKLTWAQTSTIEEWEKLGYCPSVFILKPGQHLLINKGRLHAFRKMTFDELPENDCHSQLRKKMIAELKAQNIHRPPLCVSVAFDWSFVGITAEGINRELATTLESAALCRKYTTCKSLAIPETSVLRMADSVPNDLNHNMPLQATHFGSHRTEYVLSWWQIIRGILPSLRYIINRDNFDFDSSRSKKIRFSDFPDTHLNEVQSGIDPYGNDYFCNICSHELANTYFHCQGCESLLAKDFNICTSCYNDGAYAINVEMHKCGKTAMASNFHHFGKPKSQCSNPSKHNMKCNECNKCSLCHCTCHTVFQMRRRFYTEGRQRKMLERCEQLIKGDEIKYSLETEYQLFGEPMISVQETPSNGLLITATETENMHTLHSEGIRIVTDICQRKFTVDNFNERDVDINGMDDSCINPPASSTRVQRFYVNETQRMNIQGPSKSVNGEKGSDILTTWKTPPCSVEVIDVDVDNESDSSENTSASNGNAGELQNVNMTVLRNMDEVHPSPLKSVTKRTSIVISSPKATVHNDMTYCSMSPSVVPVDSNECIEYDAV